MPWKTGLHLLPATRLVRLAQSVRSTIFLKCGDKLADARSIVSILLLTATMGTIVDVEISGDDEAVTASAIAQIFAADDDGALLEQQKPE